MEEEDFAEIINREVNENAIWFSASDAKSEGGNLSERRKKER